MRWRLRRSSDSGDAGREPVGTGPGERVLATADDAEGTHVVATNHRLRAVDTEGEQVLDRPWHLVDAGVWDHDSFTLTVTWVDGAGPARWVLTEPGMLPETVRERVQASVVLADRVALPGNRSARVVVRADLATGDLLDQVILGKGVGRDDPGVAVRVESVRAHLREQVGLD
jgi:hypothetical protein